MLNQDADLAEFLIAQNRRELKLHPRSPVIVTPTVAKEIDMSGIFRMSREEAEEACAQWSAA